MAYTFNGTNISTLGLHVQSVDGALDVLKRKAWDKFAFLDSDGEEYYVTSDDIVFEGRNIDLNCWLYNTTSGWETQRQALDEILTAGIISLVLPYSAKTYSVYCVNGSQIRKITKRLETNTAAKIKIKFREPVPDDSLEGGDALPGSTPSRTYFKFDALDVYYNFGIGVKEAYGYDDLPAQKKYKVFSHPFSDGEDYSQDEEELFWNARDIILDCWMVGDTLADFMEKLRLLKDTLFQTGLWDLIVPGAGTYQVYCKDGAKVKLIKMTGDKIAATFKLKLREPAPSIDRPPPP